MKEKIKIMKTRPQVTEEEIKAFMDFDALLEQKDKMLLQRGRIRRVRNLFIGLACLVAIPATVLLLRESGQQTMRQTAEMNILQPSTQSPVGHDSVTSEQVLQEKETPAPEEIGKKPTVLKQDTSHPEDNPVTKEPQQLPSPVYVQAEPVAGYPALYDYFDKDLVYPGAAVKDRVEGVVNVAFVIDTTGKAVSITVENSLGPLFDKEVIRLIEHMPPWRPASYNGRPVQSKISLPITFSVK